MNVTSNNIAKNRIDWLDTAKCLGMLLVFLGHLLESGDPSFSELVTTNRYIYSFHMPMFFLLAGMFFKPSPARFGKLVISKFKSRLVPVLFFTLITLPFWQYPSTWLITNVDPNTVNNHLWRLIRGFPNLNWPCWFLVCLMVVELIASELVPMLNTRRKLLFAILALYIVGRLVTDKAPLAAIGALEARQTIWFLQESFVALSFYLVGYTLAQSSMLDREITHFKRLALLLFLLCIYALTSQLDFSSYTIAKVNMSSSEHGNWLYFPIAAISGSLIFLLFSQLVPSCRLIAYIGNNTLPLIGLNGLFLHFFNKQIAIWCDGLAVGLPLVILYIVVSLACLLVCLPIVWLLNRFAPLMIGKWR